MPEKILIADDEKSAHSILQRALASRRYQTSSAYNGNEAMRLALSERPDLILLDINMPDKDGKEVLKELRHNAKTQAIPVIMVTGSGALDDKLDGFGLGADDYLTKPFPLPELIARVEGMLRRNKRDLSANPLTRLPGSPVIEEEVCHRIWERQTFAFFYIDIDSFKAFNDVYGYTSGDRAILQTSEILQAVQEKMGVSSDLLGHIGGDDFVLITGVRRAEDMAREIARRFDAAAPALYRREDLDRGYLRAKDRQGNERRFPFMSLSIAIVTNENRRLEHYAKVVDIASEIKHHLKTRTQRPGSAFLKDRRIDAKTP